MEGSMVSDLEELQEQYHRSVGELIKGNPSPQEQFWSRSDDVTLANPLGPPARGWAEVSAAMRRAASQLSDGEGLESERISGSSGGDLAYTLEIERCRVKVGGANELAPSSLRVTTIFRREEDGWKVLHRHADPIMTPQPIESVVQE
jgi:ketosteroid isomerase-like protein